MDLRENYARFFNQTFNRGRLQRAERPQSRDEGAEFTLPLPPAAGGEFDQSLQPVIFAMRDWGLEYLKPPEEMRD